MKFDYTLLDNNECMLHIFNDKDDLIGYCIHSVDDYNRATIAYIKVFGKYRRQGIATSAIKELLSKYTQLIWDYKFTDVGRKWFDALIKNNIITQ